MQIIISPSKTQAPADRKYHSSTIPLYQSEAFSLIQKLQTFTVKELSSLMKMSEQLAEMNWQRFRTFQHTPNSSNSCQALLTYQGDVFSGIDSDSYSDDEFSFAQSHLKILSGLYGILRPLDLIQPHRLEISTRFSNSKEDSLYNVWKQKITTLLTTELERSTYPCIVNLASNEYSKVVDFKKIKAPCVNIEFREKKGDTYKTVAIHAKRARGKMVNHIVKNRLERPEQLESFAEDGYVYQAALSSATRFVFHRDQKQ